MPIIDPKDLDPIQGGKIITADQLDPMSTPPPLGDVTSQSLNMFNPTALPQPVKDIGAGMINQMPTAGMVLGGAVGGIPGAGLGAGIGAAGRGMVQEALGLRPPQLPGQNINDIAWEGLSGVLGEAGGPLIAKGIQKVTSPFAAGYEKLLASNPVAKAGQRLVEERGTGITPDVLNPGRLSKFTTWLADKIWPASTVMNRMRQGLPELADTLKNEFASGQGIYNTSKAGIDAAWGKWVDLSGGPETQLVLPKFTEVLNKVSTQPYAMEMKEGVATPMGTFWKKYAGTIKDELNNTGATNIQAVRDFLAVVNPMGAKGAERTARNKLVNTLIEDLAEQSSPEAVDALNAARQMSRVNYRLAPVRNLIQRSMRTDPITNEYQINPSKFEENWKMARDSFLDNKNFSAEDIKVMDDFANKMASLTEDLKRMKSYSPTLNRMDLRNPLPAVGAVYANPWLTVPLGADVGMAHSLMSPNGIMRKFLTTGFNPPVLSSKIGIQKAMEEMQP